MAISTKSFSEGTREKDRTNPHESYAEQNQNRNRKRTRQHF